MADQSLLESLRKLNKEKEPIGISYKRFSINSANIDKLQKDINSQKLSNYVDDRVKGISKEIALNLDDKIKQRDLLSQLQNTCQMNREINREKRPSIILPNIYLIGYVILSVLSFTLGIFSLHFMLTRFFNGFIRFLIHLVFYTLTFIPLHIYSNHAPKGKKYMKICTTIENVLMISLVNKYVSLHFGKGYFIISIIVILIMSLPAILVSLLFSLSSNHSDKN